LTGRIRSTRDFKDIQRSFENGQAYYFDLGVGDRLAKKQGDVSMPPEGFFVEGTEGPLRDGELERAAAWARQIVTMQ